jgi:hypothetical protein
MGSTKLIAKCLEDMMQNALVTKEEQDFCPGKCRERVIFVGDGSSTSTCRKFNNDVP